MPRSLATIEWVIERTREVAALVARARVRFVGPAVARAPEQLEAAFAGGTELRFRDDGLSAHDLAEASLSTLGPAAGLPRAGDPLEPLYNRPAQAEARVRLADLRGLLPRKPVEATHHRSDVQGPITFTPTTVNGAPRFDLSGIATGAVFHNQSDPNGI